MKLVTIAALAALIVLGGCSSIKKLTGQRDDTVLPGQREDVISPDKQVAQDPAVTGNRVPQGGQSSTATSSKKCKLNDINCVPPDDTIEQEPIDPPPQ